jgi:hypothetical protein
MSEIMRKLKVNAKSRQYFLDFLVLSSGGGFSHQNVDDAFIHSGWSPEDFDEWATANFPLNLWKWLNFFEQENSSNILYIYHEAIPHLLNFVVCQRGDDPAMFDIGPNRNDELSMGDEWEMEDEYDFECSPEWNGITDVDFTPSELRRITNTFGSREFKLGKSYLTIIRKNNSYSSRLKPELEDYITVKTKRSQSTSQMQVEKAAQDVQKRHPELKVDMELVNNSDFVTAINYVKKLPNVNLDIIYPYQNIIYTLRVPLYLIHSIASELKI